jgi:hypothetical protein
MEVITPSAWLFAFEHCLINHQVRLVTSGAHAGLVEAVAANLPARLAALQDPLRSRTR